MASVQPVLKASAELVWAIHSSNETVPKEICELADKVEYAMAEYQIAVDYAQERRTNYRVRGKRK